jgi:hypothetical protein
MHCVTGTILMIHSTHTLLNEEIHQIIDSYHQLLYNSWCNTTLD